MGIRVTVHDQSSTGRVIGALELDDIPAAITLRDLIRTRVREEVARRNAAGAQIAWEGEATQALDAFARNGFFVLVDDRQVTDLHEELALTADSDVRFVRLVQLVGG